MHPLLIRYAEQARAVMHPGWFDYLATGAADEISLHEAELAWQGYRLRPRVLQPVPQVSTEIDLFGHRLGTPVLVAPTAWHRMADAEGECATARGAAAAGSLMTVSTRASVPIADIAAAAGPWWFQVYLTRERRAIAGLVRAAVDAGARALVLTGDTPMVSTRARRDVEPPSDGSDGLVNLGRFLPAGAPQQATWQDPAASLADIAWLAEISGLPVLVKGVLRADDALACLAAGAAGIVVSNHGGRQLDRVVATADALPEVVEAVNGRVPVLVDGGIRSGIDVLVALALGADAVMVGRPVLWGLAAEGAAGVTGVLDTLTSGLREAMTLLGTASVDAVRLGGDRVQKLATSRADAHDRP